MLSLTDLTLNRIEATGSSLQEVLELVQIPRTLLKRHPIIKVTLEHTLHRRGSMYGRDDPIAPGIELKRIDLGASFTVEFDGQFTLNWHRDFVTEELDQYLSILTEHYPTCVPGSGTFCSEEIQPIVDEIVRIWPCRFEPGLMYAGIVSPDGDRLFSINLFDLDDLEEALESIQKIYLIW